MDNRRVRAEIGGTPEWLTDERFNDFIAGVANHEAKLLTIAVMLTNPDDSFSKTELHREIIDRQGRAIGWSPASTVPIGYCTESLAPISAVVESAKTGKRGGVVAAYKASQAGIDEKLALTGFLLDWSLRNPQVSLQDVFSTSNSTEEVRAPVARYRILQELCSVPNGWTIGGMAQVTRELGYAYDALSISNHLTAMERAGILKTNSKRIDNDPEIQIIDPQYKHIAIAFEDLNSETQAIYRTMAALYPVSPRLCVSAFMEKLAEINPNVDMGKVRYSLVGMTHTHHLPGIEYIDPTSSTSNIELNETARGAIGALVGGLERVRSGYGVEDYKQKAADIVNDPAAFSMLMKKAKEHSPFARSREAVSDMASLIASIVVHHEPVTVAKVHEALVDSGHTMDPHSVRAILRKLVKRGELKVEIARPKEKQGIIRKNKVYSRA